MDYKKILAEKTSLDIDTNRKTIRGRETGRRRFFRSSFAVFAIMGFLVVSLPFAIVGETVDFQNIMQRIGLLEKRMHRIRSLADYKIPDKVELCGQAIPMDRAEVREAFEREFYLSLGLRTSAIVWAKRGGRYFPHIEACLKARKMPEDIKYLAVAESNLDIYAHSPSKALGLWQFMPGTGKHYGLRVDHYIDERRDFLRSTDAALTYLQELYSQFNDWHLAMASYNAGPGRVSREIKEQGVNYYFDLNLPLETERYIYRIAVIKTIIEGGDKYGLGLPQSELYQPYAADAVDIEVPVKNMYLGVISDAMGITFKEIRELNPALDSGYLPRGECRIYLPPGSADKFKAVWKDGKGIKNLRTGRGPESRRRVHVVKRGETLASISRKYNVSVSDLCRWNNMNRKDVLRVGKRLIIH